MCERGESVATLFHLGERYPCRDKPANIRAGRNRDRCYDACHLFSLTNRCNSVDVASTAGVLDGQVARSLRILSIFPVRVPFARNQNHFDRGECNARVPGRKGRSAIFCQLTSRCLTTGKERVNILRNRVSKEYRTSGATKPERVTMNEDDRSPLIAESIGEQDISFTASRSSQSRNLIDRSNAIQVCESLVVTRSPVQSCLRSEKLSHRYIFRGKIDDNNSTVIVEARTRPSSDSTQVSL